MHWKSGIGRLSGNECAKGLASGLFNCLLLNFNKEDEVCILMSITGTCGTLSEICANVGE